MGGGDGSELLYLTYFNNFDTSTKIDHPIIGSDFQLNTRDPTYTKTTLNCMDTSIPALNIYNNTTVRWTISSTITIPDSIEAWSIEYFFYIPYIGNSIGTAMYASPSGYNMGCDPFGWKNYIGGIWGYSDTQVYNGTTLVTSGSDKYFKLPINLYNTLIHYAVVVNSATKEFKAYLNGTLYCSYIKTNTPVHQANPYITTNNGWSATMSQVAIFGYDKSINSGANYPVPTSPYVSI